MNKRRKYDRDFKRNAVLLCAEPGRTVTKVAENLGVAKDLLYRWRREYLNFLKTNKLPMVWGKIGKIRYSF